METQAGKESVKPSLFGMFASPGEQFEKIRENPRIWVPMLIVSIFYAIGMALMAYSMDASTLAGQGIPEENAEAVLAATRITIAVSGVITPILVTLVSSAILLIITKIASSAVTFRQLFSMQTYILIIGAAGILLNAAIRAVIGGNPEIYITSLAGLLNMEKPGLLGAFEVFSIWQTVLTAIGLHKVAQLSKGLSWTIAIVFFLFGVGMALIGSLFQGMAG